MTGHESKWDNDLSSQQADFKNLVMDAAGALEMVASVCADPNEPFALQILFKGCEWPWNFYLGNVFRESLRQSVESKRRMVQAFVSEFAKVGPLELTDDIRRQLLPLIRPSTFGVPENLPLVNRPLLPCLREYVGIDREHTTEFVDRTRRERWGVSEAALFKMAHEGFSSRGIALEQYPEADFRLLSVVTACEPASSWLVKDEFLESARGSVKGNPIAIIPHQDLLMVSGDAEPGAVERMLEIARREYESGERRSLSRGIYTVDDEGRVIPFLPGELEHPLHDQIHLAHLQTAAEEYAVQKRALDERHRRSGIDCFVASYQILQNPDGQVLSWTAWPPAGEVLLAEAEWLAFMIPTVLVGLALWGDVMTIAGGCFEREPNLEPARWRAVRHPTGAELEKLRATALPL